MFMSTGHFFFLTGAVALGVCFGILLAYGIMKTWKDVAGYTFVGLIFAVMILVAVGVSEILPEGPVNYIGVGSVVLLFSAYMYHLGRQP